MAVAEEENHLDNIFFAMGELKPFSVRQVLAFSLVCFPAAYQLLGNVFICRDIPHQCAPPPDNDSTALFTGLDNYGPDDLSVSYEKCQIVVSDNDTVLKTHSCLYGMEYQQGIDASARSQFDLVCEYSSLARLSQTLVIAGQGIGATIFTMISDRIGRKPVLVFSNFGLLVCGMTIAFAPNYTVFAIFRFLAGGFQQGCWATLMTFFLEVLTTSNRRIQALCGGIMWGVGAMSLTLWAYIFKDHSWRTLQVAFSLSSVPFIFQLWYGRESLRWLIANGKSKAVVALLRKATTVNKTSFDKTMKAYEEVCHDIRDSGEGQRGHEEQTPATATPKLTLLDLLKVRRLFFNTLIMWIAWFTTALCFFAIYMDSSTLAGDPYLNFFLIAMMEIPNNFILYLLLNRYGRKFTMVIVFSIVSIGLVMSAIFKSLEQTDVHASLALVGYLIAMTGASASFNFIFFYTPEIFPTNVRNQAVGVSSLMGRVGGMISPFIGILGQKSKWVPGVLSGSLALLVCLLSVFLPETRGKELPQTIEDLLSWFSNKNDVQVKNSTDKKEDAITHLFPSEREDTGKKEAQISLT